MSTVCTGLEKISEARRALALVSTIDEAKGVADIADAAALWAKRAKAGTAAQNEAAEIAILAKRKGGE